MAMKDPVHPGRIVRGTIEELDVSVTAAAKALRVSRPADMIEVTPLVAEHVA